MIEACKSSKWKNPFALESLAAASAENGDYAHAVKIQKQVLEDKDYVEFRGDILKRVLALYESKKPFRLPGHAKVN